MASEEILPENIVHPHSVFMRSFSIAEDDAVWGDFECGFGACEEGEVAKVSVANGEIIADGNVVMSKVFVEHRVYIIEAIFWVFVFVELAHNDASYIC